MSILFEKCDLQFFETKILINLLQVSVFLLKKSFFSKLNTIVILVVFLLLFISEIYRENLSINNIFQPTFKNRDLLTHK